jgi:hypothetical protein
VRAIHASEIVDAHDALDGFQKFELVEAGMHTDASVIDESIDSAVFVERSINQRSALGFDGDISRDADRSGPSPATFSSDSFQ